MYELHTTLIASDGCVMDTKITKFGIRDIKFDTEEGFLLNGKSVKIKGVNIHHDLGCMGVAAYDDALLRRLLKLRSIAAMPYVQLIIRIRKVCWKCATALGFLL